MSIRNSFPYTYKPAFPADLSEKINRKAQLIGKRAEEQAANEMIRSAKGALGRGMSPLEIEIQLNLK